MITYDEALERIESYLGGYIRNNEQREVFEVARKALKNEIGRSRRFETALEDAESDYARDFAAEQDLYGEDSDSFLGKVKADGFDIMDAFHDGAEWRREHVWHNADRKPYTDGALLVEYSNGQYDVTGYSELTWRTIKRWDYLDEITIK